MLQPTTKDRIATHYFNGDYLKALGDGKIGGYLVVFGGPPDAQGEWFTSECNFHLDWYDGQKRPILYHHGLKDENLIEEIGFIYKITVDGHGLYAEGQLDMANPRARNVYSDVNRGRIGWSSGSAPHLSKVLDDGCIIEWAIVEASLTPTPAAGKRTTVQALKFDTSTFKPDDPSSIEFFASAGDKITGNDVTKGKRRNTQTSTGQGTMTLKIDTSLIAAMQKAGISSDQIIEVLQNADEGDMGGEMMANTETGTTPVDTSTMSADPAKDAGPVTVGDGGADIRDTGGTPAMTPPAQNPPGSGATAAGKTSAKTNGDTSTNGQLNAQLIKMLIEQHSAQKTAPAKSKVVGFEGNNPTRTTISNMKTVYHDLNSADMAFLYEMRRQGKNPRQMGVEYEREMATKAMKEYTENKLTLAPDVARKVAIKLDFNNTSVPGDGGSWVPDLWSSILWQRVRIDNNVAKNIEVFQMPSPTFEYPIESSDPIVYSVGESDTDAEQTLATNVFTRSKLTVTKLTFTAKKTGLQVGFSTEIEEDSIIPFIPQLRAQATRTFANSIDNNILNSDSTTGTGNINYKGANTSAVPTANFLFGGGNGMRYNALVSNTGVQQNFAGGIPTLLGIRALRFKMISATNAYGINPEDLVMITDPFTYGKFLSIDEINVFMNNGQGATVNTGLVPNIDGVPIYASAELLTADNTGYATAANYPGGGAPSSSNLGNFLFFAKNAWKIGYVRQVMTDVSYVPWNDSYILTMTARYAIGKKDTVSAALAYNIQIS